MVKLLLGLAAVPSPHDAADALAVAICHVHSQPPARVVGPALAQPPRSWRRTGRGRERDRAGDRIARDRPPARTAFSRNIRTASSSTSPASATTCSCRCRRSTASATPAAAIALRIHTHVREDALAALRVRDAARAGSVRAADRRQRHRAEGRARGAVGHRAAGADARDRARRSGAADRDSRRRQEDLRAHRPRAEGSAAARPQRRRAGGGAAPRPPVGARRRALGAR